MRAAIRRFMTLFAAMLIGTSLLAPVAHAAPKATTSITLKVPAKATSGNTMKLTATVTGGVKGQKVVLQVMAGGKWVTVKQKKLPAKGTSSKKVTFKIPASSAGEPHYRALVKKNKKAKKSTSKEASIPISSPLTLSVNATTAKEVTTVTFSGTLTGAASEGTPVTLQINHGSDPFTGTWKKLTSVPMAEDGSFSGKVTVPVKRGIDNNGAPQINFRATVPAKKGTLYSNMQGFLVKTEYQRGSVFQYDSHTDDPPREVGTLVVLYSDRWFRMHFGAYPVIGTTDGWDLVDNEGMRLKAKHMKAGKWCMAVEKSQGSYCVGSADGPWILYQGRTRDGIHITSWGELIPT